MYMRSDLEMGEVVFLVFMGLIDGSMEWANYRHTDRWVYVTE
jgi:hypothetical protein